MEFRKAAVIGTGMMGPGIAVTLSLGGVAATLVSRTPEGAEQGLAAARRQAELLRANGLGESRAPVDATSGFDAAIAQADIVIESAPENMEFKQDLFARLDSIAKPGAVLASNTSGLSITAIASRCSRPGRVLTTHFWNPPHLMPLVEVVRGEHTAPETAREVFDLLASCGKRPVLVRKDTPGQLGNRLQMALVREAIHIIEQGIASAEDVDLAAKCGFGLRLPVYGILEHQDIVGLDLGLSVVDYVARDLYSERRAPEMIHRLVREGHLGVKTGSGFYDWSHKDAAAIKNLRDAFVLDFVTSRFAKDVS